MSSFEPYNLTLDLAAFFRRENVSRELQNDQTLLEKAVIRLANYVKPLNQSVEIYLDKLHYALGELRHLENILSSVRLDFILMECLANRIQNIRKTIQQQIILLKKSARCLIPVELYLRAV